MINMIEKVQHKQTRHKPYEERLEVLNLYSLEQRQLRGDLIEVFKILNVLEGVRRWLRGDLIEVFKILNGLEGVSERKFFQRSIVYTQLRGHPSSSKPALKKGLNIRRQFFSVRIINKWNILPASVVKSKKTNQLKNELEYFLE